MRDQCWMFDMRTIEFIYQIKWIFFSLFSFVSLWHLFLSWPNHQFISWQCARRSKCNKKIKKQRKNGSIKFPSNISNAQCDYRKWNMRLIHRGDLFLGIEWIVFFVFREQNFELRIERTYFTTRLEIQNYKRQWISMGPQFLSMYFHSVMGMQQEKKTLTCLRIEYL